MKRSMILFLLLSLFSGIAQARVLVMLHGYLGKGGTWREAGITRTLAQAGWADGGHLWLQQDQVMNARHIPVTASQTFYTLDTPSMAPLAQQASLLTQFLKAIRERHPGESVTLAGFSAGGVVARLAMVMKHQSHQSNDIARLITIASPHLGTELAEIGLQMYESPLAWVAPWLGAEGLNHSGGLYYDLQPEQPGTILYWLNRQEHPAAEYISIVRTNNGLLEQDLVVSEQSQNMNFVPALRGYSRVIPSRGMHQLQQEDAALVLQILDAGQRI